MDVCRDAWNISIPGHYPEACYRTYYLRLPSNLVVLQWLSGRIHVRSAPGVRFASVIHGKFDLEILV